MSVRVLRNNKLPEIFLVGDTVNCLQYKEKLWLLTNFEKRFWAQIFSLGGAKFCSRQPKPASRLKFISYFYPKKTIKNEF